MKILKASLSDRLFGFIVASSVTLFTLFCLLPFWLMVSGSLTDEMELIDNGYSLFPKQFSTLAYRLTFDSAQLLQSYKLSVFVTVTGTVIALLVTSMLASAVANKRNPARTFMSFFVIFLLLFNGGLIPFYILVSKWLHLYDTVWALIVPNLVQPFLVFLMISFFRSLPYELEEAALVDGANEFTIFFRIILPISKPILATIGLFYALSYWNDWLLGMLFAGDSRLYPLQVILRNMISNLNAANSLIPDTSSITVTAPALGIRMATTVITIGPIVFLYPLVQRYFVKGLTIGAVKG